MAQDDDPLQNLLATLDEKFGDNNDNDDNNDINNNNNEVVDIEKKMNKTYIAEVKNQGIDENTQGSIYVGRKIYEDPNVKSFKDLELKGELLDACAQLNWIRPSKIQATALPILLKPNSNGEYPNLIGQAHHGSGKTGTFVLTMLQRTDEKTNKLQCMCICHSRELAIQTYEVTKVLCYYSSLKDKIFCAIPNCEKIDLNNWKYSIVIGTPGKILGEIINPSKNKNFNSFLSEFKILVIDEADELLKNKETLPSQRKPQFNTRGRGNGKNAGRGGHGQIIMNSNTLGNLTDQTRSIVSTITKFRHKKFQGLLFSATFPDSVIELANTIAPNAQVIKVENKKLSLDNIKLYKWYQTDDKSKLNALKQIISILNIGQLIIFVNLVRTAQDLVKILQSKDINIACSALYGKDMKPEDRDKTMENFREGQTTVLIASNVIARGIDVPSVKLVVNYDICDDRETFLHRIGRTGRFGTKGASINFYSDKISDKTLNDVCEHYNLKISEIQDDDDLKNINEWIQNE